MKRDTFKDKARTAYLKKTFPEITDVRAKEGAGSKAIAFSFELEGTTFYEDSLLVEFDAIPEDINPMIGYSIKRAKKIISGEKKTDPLFVDGQICGIINFKEECSMPIDFDKAKKKAEELVLEHESIQEIMQAIENLNTREYERKRRR